MRYNSKEEPETKLYAGIDLQSNNSVVTLIDEHDRVVAEKRLADEVERIVLLLAAFRDALVGIVVESTFNWYWLVDGLMQGGSGYTWPTPRRSSSTRASSTPTTSTMRAGSRTCCGWASCARDTSIRASRAGCAI